MAMAETVLTLLIAGVASFFMAWSIGAGSSGSTPFAPAVGANAISVLRAGFFVGILGLLGASLQGANVTETVGTELTTGAVISPAGATIGLLIAGGLVAVGVGIGYPIATAFTVTGAMIGVGLAVGGDPAWGKYWEIGALWTATPILGGGTAFVIVRVLNREAITERKAVSLLGGVVALLVANVQFSILGPRGSGASIAQALGSFFPRLTGIGAGGTIVVTGLLAGGTTLVLRRELGKDTEVAQQRFLLALGALVAFSAGGSQVGLAIGPLLPILGDLTTRFPLGLVLFGGGVGLLVGSWTGAPRMIKAISQEYSSLNPRRSIAALIPSFGIAQMAIFFGLPVSFNEIIVSAILGSGYATGAAGISRTKMVRTIAAWVISFGLAMGLSLGAITVYRSVL